MVPQQFGFSLFLFVDLAAKLYSNFRLNGSHHPSGFRSFIKNNDRVFCPQSNKTCGAEDLIPDAKRTGLKFDTFLHLEIKNYVLRKVKNTGVEQTRTFYWKIE